MRVVFSVVLILLVSVVALAGLVWGLAFYAPSPDLEEARVAGLGSPSEIQIDRDGTTTIAATGTGDLALSLGYYHAAEFTWSVLLLRQTAVGRLAEWFGEALLPTDIYTRQLGFAAISRESVADLPQGQRDLLDQYVAGLNAAVTSARLARTDELALLAIEPEKLESWEVLAIERLLAWLVSPELVEGCLSSVDDRLDAFCREDRRLRAWLHLHGFEMGLASSFGDSTGTGIYLRQVYGSTALPLAAPVVFESSGATVRAISIVGVPIFSVMVGETSSAAILLSTDRRIEALVPDTHSVDATFDQTFSVVRTKEGAETLAVLRRLEDRAILQLSGANTGVLARWNGFVPGTDIPRWWTLLSTFFESPSGQSTPPSFDTHLFRGDGIWIQDGTVRVVGNPMWQQRRGNAVILGNDRLTQEVVPRWLELVAAQPVPSLRSLFRDTESRSGTEDWRAVVQEVADEQLESLVLRDAFAYLRNWDFSYQRTSIGATIFEMIRTLDRMNSDSSSNDTTASSVRLSRVEQFRGAVDSLVAVYGSDPTRWRWEIAQPSDRYYPVWSNSELWMGTVDLTSSRYAPIDVRGSGHPETLAWGPTDLDPRLPSPSVFETWGYTHTPDSLAFQASRLRVRGFLSRYRNRANTPPIYVRPSSQVDLTIRLTGVSP